MWTVLYWTRSLRTQFGVSINVWRLAGDTLNITCNFLYCNHQVHRDFFITLYMYLCWCFFLKHLPKHHLYCCCRCIMQYLHELYKCVTCHSVELQSSHLLPKTMNITLHRINNYVCFYWLWDMVNNPRGKNKYITTTSTRKPTFTICLQNKAFYTLNV